MKPHRQAPYRTRIRISRKDRGLTLKEVAAAIGTTPQTLQRLETDNMTVSIEWLFKIAKALGVPPSELLVDPGAPARSSEDEFLAMLQAELMRARQTPCPLPDLAMLGLQSEFGELAKVFLNWRHGYSPWDVVVKQASAMAACVTRLALDGEPAPAQDAPTESRSGLTLVVAS